MEVRIYVRIFVAVPSNALCFDGRVTATTVA